MEKIIGVVSDTHNFLPSNIEEGLKGSDLIIHAGDIGGQAIIDRLEAIAKVVAVYGNSDYGDWTKKYKRTQLINFAGKNIYVRHILKELDFNPSQKGIDLVVYGHTHEPKIETIDGVIYLNPGAMLTPQGYTYAVVTIKENNIKCDLIALGW